MAGRAGWARAWSRMWSNQCFIAAAALPLAIDRPRSRYARSEVIVDADACNVGGQIGRGADGLRVGDANPRLHNKAGRRYLAEVDEQIFALQAPAPVELPFGAGTDRKSNLV